VHNALVSLAVRSLALLAGARGQTLAEYGLILTLVAVGVMVPTAFLLRDQIANAFDQVALCLDGSC